MLKNLERLLDLDVLFAANICFFCQPRSIHSFSLHRIKCLIYPRPVFQLHCVDIVIVKCIFMELKQLPLVIETYILYLLFFLLFKNIAIMFISQHAGVQILGRFFCAILVAPGAALDSRMCQSTAIPVCFPVGKFTIRSNPCSLCHEERRQNTAIFSNQLLQNCN